MILASDNSDSLDGFAHALIHSRQHVSPKRLIEPGPNSTQKLEILNAAGAAPDHGKVTPWHFYEVSPESRNLLGGLFADALIARDPGATPTQVDEARQKAFRGPLLLLATAKLNNALDNIPEQEKLISAGCAIQNVLLMANALGFGSGVDLFDILLKRLNFLGQFLYPVNGLLERFGCDTADLGLFGHN